MNHAYRKLLDKRNLMFPPKLEFGAEFECGVAGEWRVCGVDGNYVHLSTPNGMRCVMNKYGSNKNILGLPVSLADVLMMIEANPNNDKPYATLVLMTNGRLGWDGEEGAYELVAVLDLSIPVSAWSEETLNKVLELL